MSSRPLPLRTLGVSSLALSMTFLACGCATPQDRCREYVSAINFVMEQCGIPGSYNVVDARDPDRIGCQWVAAVENPGEVVRCVRFLNQVVTNMECGIPELVDFPPRDGGESSLPAYCTAGNFTVAAH